MLSEDGKSVLSGIVTFPFGNEEAKFIMWRVDSLVGHVDTLSLRYKGIGIPFWGLGNKD